MSAAGPSLARSLLVRSFMHPQSAMSRRFCASGPHAGTSSREASRLLVVDDEVHARAALAELLREAGYLVETAGGGLQALPKLVDFAPELLVTDLEMPDMDGIALMCKAQQYDPLLPVIITTASCAIDSAVSAMRHGAADYLTKPLDVDRLMLSVEQALDRRHAQRNSGLTMKYFRVG